MELLFGAAAVIISVTLITAVIFAVSAWREGSREGATVEMAGGELPLSGRRPRQGTAR